VLACLLVKLSIYPRCERLDPPTHKHPFHTTKPPTPNTEPQLTPTGEPLRLEVAPGVAVQRRLLQPKSRRQHRAQRGTPQPLAGV
jgi:hypothetical protein